MWVEAVSSRTRVSVDALWRIARSASKRYYEFNIKKADGTDRLIEHPSRSLKALQRLIIRDIVTKAPVHQAATAYSKGSKILRNASHHSGTRFTTRLDFENFFPSFDAKSVADFFRNLVQSQSLGLDESDIEFVTRISCRNNRLVIGAPTSPKITNAMMYKFDCAAVDISKAHDVIYTRYADDIYISTNHDDTLSAVESEIRTLIKDYKFPILKLKESKTLYLSRSGHRSVTGLVLTPTGEVSIGRDRKREIRTLTYLAINKKLNKENVQRLAGLLSFAYDNEPDFIARLSSKFDTDIVAWFKAGCSR